MLALCFDPAAVATLLRNKLSGSVRLGEEREAQVGSGAFELANRPLTQVLIIGLLTLGLIGRVMFEDLVEDPGQLMCGGGDCRRRAFTCPQAAIRTAQGGLRAAQGLRGQAQHLCRPAIAFEGLTAQDLSA